MKIVLRTPKEIKDILDSKKLSGAAKIKLLLSEIKNTEKKMEQAESKQYLQSLKIRCQILENYINELKKEDVSENENS